MQRHDIHVRDERTDGLASVTITDFRGDTAADAVFDAIEAAEGLTITE